MTENTQELAILRDPYLVPPSEGSLPGASPLVVTPYEDWEHDLFYFLACVYHQCDSQRASDVYDRLIGFVR